jgi:hypothetical protein
MYAYKVDQGDKVAGKERLYSMILAVFVKVQVSC